MTHGSKYFYPYAVNFWTQPGKAHTVCDRLQVLKEFGLDKKILLWSLEVVDTEVLAEAVKFIVDNALASRTFWVLQPSHQYPSHLLHQIGDHLYRLDSDLLLLDLHVRECCTSVPNCEWHSNTGRFLFPTGKPDRINRIRLLYKLDQAGLLSHCDWSLFVTNHTYARCRDLLIELTDNEFDTFVDAHNRSLDHIRISHCTENSNHSDGYPFDGRCYQHSSFRIISETMMGDQGIVSEKTWITMANRMPFIVAGHPHNLRYLKQQGYRTFENYLPIPGYDQIEDSEQRLDAVVTNTKFWLSNIHTQRLQISEDVEHNYQLLTQNVNKHLEMAKSLAESLEDPHRTAYSLMPLSIEQWNWTSFYYNIKDESWPECWLEQNFNDLPLEIQKECIEKFGYEPRNMS